MKRFLLVLSFLIVFTMLFVPAIKVAAQTESPPTTGSTDVSVPLLPPLKNAGDVINWLIGPGLTVAVAWFMSFLADKFAFWKKVPHDIKVVAPFVVALGMVLLGTTLLKNFPAFLQDKQLNTIVLSLVFFLTTQKQHAKFDAKAKAP